MQTRGNGRVSTVVQAKRLCVRLHYKFDNSLLSLLHMLAPVSVLPRSLLHLLSSLLHLVAPCSVLASVLPCIRSRWSMGLNAYTSTWPCRTLGERIYISHGVFYGTLHIEISPSVFKMWNLWECLIHAAVAP